MSARGVPVDDARRGREEALAWAATALALLFFAWRSIMLFRATGAFRSMFEGLGAQLPAVTRLAVDYREVVIAIVCGVPALVVIGKELVVRDKRTSVMITMLVVIAFLIAVDMLVTAYYLPLFDLMGKLG
jgi:type II secretory pathway component PulF